MSSNQKKIIATCKGYEQFGLITVCWLWNLYETHNGERSVTKFHAGEVLQKPDIDYSMAAKIDSWLHGGPLPKGKRLTRDTQHAIKKSHLKIN